MVREMDGNDARAMRERGLTARLGFGRAPALLVVDFINAFTDPECRSARASTMRWSDCDAAVGRPRPRGARALHHRDLRRARPRRRGPVGDEGPGQRDAARRTPRGRARPPARAARGRGAVVKKYASAFFGTDLATRLTTAGVDTVVIAGCTHQRLRARERGRRAPARVPTDGRARGGRRPRSRAPTSSASSTSTPSTPTSSASTRRWPSSRPAWWNSPARERPPLLLLAGRRPPAPRAAGRRPRGRVDRA